MSTSVLLTTIEEHMSSYADVDVVNNGLHTATTAATTALSNSDTGIIGKTVVVVGSILMGCFLGFSIVALTEPKRDISKFIKNSDDPRVAERKAIQQYQEKYSDELSRLDSKDISDEKLACLSKSYVREETPFGDIIMSYNSNTESYWYYTDSKNVPFKTLDAVARCFAVTHDCKKICVNYKEELAILREAYNSNIRNSMKSLNSDASGSDASDNETTASSNDESKKKSIFATFKNYKTATNVSTSNKYPIIMQNNNRFSYKGKLKDAPNMLEESSDESPAPPKDISFAAFKNQLQKKEA